MADRTIPNPQRGCGTLERGKAYIRGTIGSPDGVLPSFVTAAPPIPFREQGTDGGFTRGFRRWDGLTAQLAMEDDLTSFDPHYPGDAGLSVALENHVDRGVYPNLNAVPTRQSQRHVDRVRYAGADGDHFGSVSATRQSDLLMRAGKTHYPDPDDFIQECIDHGLSKAIPLSQNQDPPTIDPGVTRCWIVHPDVDGSWAVIGFAYLQEVVYTEPVDGNVPQFVQDLEAADRLDVVDIEAPPDPDADAGPNGTLDDFDADGPQTDAVQEADPSDTAMDDAETGDGPDPWSTVRYNRIKAAVADADDIDVGPTPTKDEAVAALKRIGRDPADLRE